MSTTIDLADRNQAIQKLQTLTLLIEKYTPIQFSRSLSREDRDDAEFIQAVHAFNERNRQLKSKDPVAKAEKDVQIILQSADLKKYQEHLDLNHAVNLLRSFLTLRYDAETHHIEN